MGKLVDIDEDELNRLRGLHGVASRIYADPKARLLLEQAQKLVDPNAKTPAIDQRQQIEEPIEDVRKQLSEVTKRLDEEKEAREREQKLASLRDLQQKGIAKLRQQHFTDEGIAAVEKIMEEKGILDPLDAAAIFEKQNPPQQLATPGGSGGWNFMDSVADGEADLKRLIETKGESEPLLNKMVNETLKDLRGVARH